MPPEGDLKAAEEVALAEQPTAFGDERWVYLEDRSPSLRGHRW